MKKIYLFPAFVIFAINLMFPCFSFGQSYKPIIDNDTAFFQGYSDYEPGNRILGIRVDSIQESGGSKIYYFNKTWNLSDWLCINANGNSWLGPCCIQKPDGTYLFFNKMGDSIVIKPDANIGDKWIMIDFGDNGYIGAKVTKVNYENFLGLNDSVKYITLESQAYFPGEGGKYIDLDGKSIAISKNYGFVSVPNFNEITDSIEDQRDTNPVFFNLVGKRNPNVGLTLISTNEIYNFDVGDEFHCEYSSKDFPHSSYHEYSIEKVTQKEYSQNMDSVFYYFEGIVHSINFNSDDKSKNIDTIYNFKSKQAYPLITLKYLPEEPITEKLKIPELINYYRYYSLGIEPSAKRRIIQLSPHYYQEAQDDTCWTEIHDFLATKTFMEGCGLLSYMGGWDNSDAGGLVYYKKGSETWGHPLFITSVEESIPMNFSIYPNPATNIIFVNSPSNEKVRLYSPEGVKLTESSPNVQIDISALAPGIYFLRQGSRIAKFIKF